MLRFFGRESVQFLNKIEIMSYQRSGRRGRRSFGRGGYRGRHSGNWESSSEDINYNDQPQIDLEFDERERKSRGNKPPPGLRGKEIGLWYARHQKKNQRQREINKTPVVAIQGQMERKIRNLLDNIEVADNIPPQPSRSGASLEDDIELADSMYEEDQSQEPMNAEDMVDVPNLQEVREFELQEMDLGLLDDKEDEEVYMEEEVDSSKLDDFLYRQQQNKPSDTHYNKMKTFRKKLPSYNKRKEIVDMVNSNQVLVISGETGCGKTTQVPQFILDDFIERGEGSNCRLICTQPRRISAITVAERVAVERAEDCGEENSVGYCIRLEKKLPRQHGSILYCTTGILLKYLESDPLLNRATHIIMDEIHERDLLSDFLLIILKDVLPQRPDLKLILMSATLNAEEFANYYYNCPILTIPGFTYPVKEYYLEDAVELTGYVHVPETKKRRNRRPTHEEQEDQWNLMAWSRNLRGKYSDDTIQTLIDLHAEEFVQSSLITELIKHICFQMDDGAILVFVPGWGDIKKVNDDLLKDPTFRSDQFRIIPLHSLMPTVNQKTVFDRPPAGVRKIIIATNIAETSITIDDVVYVIDSGQIKVKDFQTENNITSLLPRPVPKANARQRRGRAGRVQPGHCFHLYSSYQETKLPDYLPPEILRTPLEELCLQIKLLKLGKIAPFVDKAMNRPSTEALQLAIRTLQDLQALDEDENLLPLGRHLARMPVDPHSGKMILFAAMFGCLDPVCIVAASLGFKSAFYVPLGMESEADSRKRELAGDSKSDHIMLINAFREWEKADSKGYGSQFCRRNFLSFNTLKMLRDMKQQFAGLLHDLGFIHSKRSNDRAANINASNENLVKAIVCAGLYPNVAKVIKPARIRSRQPPKLEVNGIDDMKMRVKVHRSSVNSMTDSFESNWLIYHKLMKTSDAFVFDCSMISPYPLLFFGRKIGMSQMEMEDRRQNSSLVTVDDWISFHCTDSTTQMVKDLKHQLDRILEEKIIKTGVTNWNPKSKEGAILQAIIDLITTEEVIPYKSEEHHSSNRRYRNNRHNPHDRFDNDNDRRHRNYRDNPHDSFDGDSYQSDRHHDYRHNPLDRFDNDNDSHRSNRHQNYRQNRHYRFNDDF